MIKQLKEAVKKVLKLSPIPLTKNHKYDILTKKIISRLSKTSNCIDVGCYKGEIMDLILAAAPEGQHFGIEPIPAQFTYLKNKYAGQSHCIIHNVAASNVTGESEFNYVVSNPSYSGLKKRDYDKPNEIDTKIQVKTELLDHLIPENIAIDLIKIDVEGAELLVLEGASKIIAKNLPLVIFEHGMGASNHYGSTPDKLFNFFQSMSMKVSNLENYLSNQQALSLEDFKNQYHQQKNHYFVAHK